LLVLQINIQAETGKEFAREFGSFTPTFVFIDAEGEEMWRSLGTLDAEQVRESMRK
jgi:thioredoxin-related protein